MDPLFFDDLRLEYPSIPEAILHSTINNSLQPINIMKLFTEFSEGKTDKAQDKDFDSAGIRGVNHPLSPMFYNLLLNTLSHSPTRGLNASLPPSFFIIHWRHSTIPFIRQCPQYCCYRHACLVCRADHPQIFCNHINQGVSPALPNAGSSVPPLSYSQLWTQSQGQVVSSSQQWQNPQAEMFVPTGPWNRDQPRQWLTVPYLSCLLPNAFYTH